MAVACVLQTAEMGHGAKSEYHQTGAQDATKPMTERISDVRAVYLHASMTVATSVCLRSSGVEYCGLCLQTMSAGVEKVKEMVSSGEKEVSKEQAKGEPLIVARAPF